MRGDAWLTLRLLRRRQGWAGVLVALSGGLVLAGALLPWIRATATVELLGRRETAHLGHTVLSEQGWGVPVLAAGLVLVTVGVGLAIDRPLARPVVVVTAAVTLAAVGALAATLPPPSVAEAAPTGAADLGSVTPDLPEDVAVSTDIRPGPGSVALLAGLLGAVVGVRLARDDRG